MISPIRKSPWFSIWLHPRETIHKIIVEKDPNYRLFSLSFLIGLFLLLQLLPGFQGISLGGALVFCVAVAPVLGLLMLSILAFVLLLLGKCFGGKATFVQVRAALAWALIPVVSSLLLYIVLLFVLYHLLITMPASALQISGWDVILLVGYAIVQSVLGLWSFLLLITCIAQVQGFSLFRSVCSVLVWFLAMALMVVFVMS